MKSTIQHNSNLRRLFGLAIAFIALGSCGQDINAQSTHKWNDPTGGVYANFNSWTPIGFPSTLDTAMFDLSSTYTISFISSRSADRLSLSNGVVTMEASGITPGDRIFTVNDALIENRPGNLVLQPDSDAHNMILVVNNQLDIFSVLEVLEGAKVEADSTTIGESAAPLGSSLRIEGSSPHGFPSEFQTETMTLRKGGVHISDRGLLTTTDATIYQGAVTISDPSSVWISTDELTIGANALSGVDVTDGGMLRSVTTRIGTNSGIASLLLTSSNSDLKSRFINSGDLYLGGTETIGSGVGRLLLRENSETTVFGTLKVWPGGEVEINDSATLIADVIQDTLGGDFGFLGGILAVNQFEGDLENPAGTLAPGGDGFETTFILGDYTCGPNATLSIDIGGTNPGSSHDLVQLTGVALLNGDLVVTVSSDFTPDPTDQFLVFVADSSFGNFDNVVNNERVETADGSGSFLVNYGITSPFDRNQVVLSDFQANPDAGVVTVETMSVILGNHISGSVDELMEADDMDVSVRRSNTDIQSRTQIEVTTTSPILNPGSMTVSLEGAVFARTPVIQTVELYDYDSDTWEEVDSQAARRFVDQRINVPISGDVTRFVESAKGNMKARILYQSTNPRQRFSSNIDQFIWTVGN